MIMKKALIMLGCVLGLHTFSFAQEIPVKGFAVMEPGFEFQPYEFTRHAVGNDEIQIEIMYCGICHSDLHEARQDWMEEHYPLVPGHEIAGRVVKVGKNVTKFEVGDFAGVGCIVNSCHTCDECNHNREQYYPKMVSTYNSVDYYHDGEITQGGYSNTIVVSQDYALRIPDGADMKRVAPLLCAGITTYSPIRFAGVKSGDRVGIAGFGGLGHMAVQYAVALGAKVTVFDITEEKRDDALRMGAVRYVNVNRPEELEGLNGMFDFILSTIPAPYDMSMYLRMLDFGGQFGIVGVPAFKEIPNLTLDQFIWNGGRKVFGSMIGGIRETQEMLDYSVAHGIYPEVEIIKADAAIIGEAYQNVLDGKVKFRYVIDMSTIK